MWHGFGLASHGWAMVGFTVLAAMLVLVAAALWLIELLAGWPWRDRDHPLREELQRLEHRRPTDDESHRS